MTVTEFLKSPYLWLKAGRDHSKACKAYDAALAIAKTDLSNKTLQDAELKAYEDLWDPFDRIIKYSFPTIAMTAATGLFLVFLEIGIRCAHKN